MLGAALLLPPVAFALDVQQRGYSGETWFWLWTITLGPQLMGHTVLNWALRYVEESVICATILAEDDFSALVVWLILAQKPGIPTVGAVVLAGLFLLLRGRRIPVVPLA